MPRKSATLAPLFDEKAAELKAAIDKYVDRIKAELSTKKHADNIAWWRTAQICAEAEVAFKDQPEAIEAVRKAVNISPSKKFMLVAVAKDERLRLREGEFAHSVAWTVLYHLSKLDDADLNTVLEKHRDGKDMSITSIDHALGLKGEPKPKGFRPVYTISIDTDELTTEDDIGMASVFIESVLEDLKKQYGKMIYTEDKSFARKREKLAKQNRISEKAINLEIMRIGVEKMKLKDETWRRYNDKSLRKAYGLTRPLISLLPEREWVSNYARDFESMVEGYDILEVEFDYDVLKGEAERRLCAKRAKRARKKAEAAQAFVSSSPSDESVTSDDAAHQNAEAPETSDDVVIPITQRLGNLLTTTKKEDGDGSGNVIQLLVDDLKIVRGRGHHLGMSRETISKRKFSGFK